MGTVTLELLGTSDAFASGGRFHPCHLVRHGPVCALVDCGASSPVALARRGLAPSALTHVVVTHLHGDHFGGLPFLLLDAAYNRPRSTELVIAGPAGIGGRVRQLVDALYEAAGEKIMTRVPHRFVELQARQQADVGGFSLTAFEGRHGSCAHALSLRLEIGGRTIAWSGDTEWTSTLADVARGADLFVCECTGWNEPKPSHLDHATLSAHAAAIDCRRVVLTHLGAEMLAHRHEARWPCADDGMVIEL